MGDFSELTKWLVSADTAMVAVTFVICQLSKLFLPSPYPEIPGTRPDRWAVVKQLKWVPFVLAFVCGILLSVIFDMDKGESLISKFRAGFQTGAYAVVVYLGYDLIAKPVVEKIIGRTL